MEAMGVSFSAGGGPIGGRIEVVETGAWVVVVVAGFASPEHPATIITRAASTTHERLSITTTALSSSDFWRRHSRVAPGGLNNASCRTVATSLPSLLHRLAW